ncbi:MAG: hypothetical protein DBY36_06695 [Clostridiales bacterium]|nr:MAG: hypothetical protein DBY36_06695 [Clostridiales bacterium]
MIRLLCGVLSFALMLAGDLLFASTRRPVWKTAFPVGFAVCAGSTVWIAVACAPEAYDVWRLAAFGILAVVFGVLLVHALFFALPAAETYGLNGGKTAVCDSGVYALCRHPGVWWFAMLYLSLFGMGLLPLPAALVFPAANFLYAAAQDKWVFEKTLAGYAAYKRRVPCFLPTAESVRRCIGRRGGRG